MRKRATVLVFILLAIKKLSACPQNCQCSSAPMAMVCTSSGTNDRLTAIPAIPSQAVQVILDNNAISHIGDIHFQGIGDFLVYLSINNNTISMMEDGAFQRLSNLLVLSLSRNSITQLNTAVFVGLNKTSILSVDNNDIVHIDCGVFEPMSSLQHLRLGQNGLTTIESCTFSGLGNIKSLDLSNNKLLQVATDAFTNMQNLKILLLNNNFLTALEPNWFAYKQLIVAQLSGNPWVCSCASYNSINEAQQLGPQVNCQDDNMCVICNNPPFRLVHFSSIGDVYWHQCNTSLTTTAPQNEATRDAEMMNEQHSSHKVLRSLAAGELFSDTVQQKQGFLTCDNNNITCHLIGANVTYILKKDIPTTMENLYLDRNRFQFINTTDFVDILNLTIFQITFNIISEIEDFSFAKNTKLQDLRLNDNMLTSINVNTFQGLSALKDLHLENNQISTRLTGGIFKHLRNLETLYLQHNLITNVDDCAFCNITSIRILNLDHNRISSLQSQAFKGLTRLTQLQIANNQIKMFDFTKLNGLHLTAIGTTGNMWMCDCTLKDYMEQFVGNFTPNCANGIGYLCVRCTSPTNLANQELRTIPRSNITGCVITTTPSILDTTTTSETITHNSTTLYTTEATSTLQINQSTSATSTVDKTSLQSTSESATLQMTSQTSMTKKPGKPALVSGISKTETILYIVIPVAVLLLLVILGAFLYITFKKKPMTRTPTNFGSNGRYEPANNMGENETPVPMEVLNVFEDRQEDVTLTD